MGSGGFRRARPSELSLAIGVLQLLFSFRRQFLPSFRLVEVVDFSFGVQLNSFLPFLIAKKGSFSLLFLDHNSSQLLTQGSPLDFPSGCFPELFFCGRAWAPYCLALSLYKGNDILF